MNKIVIGKEKFVEEFTVGHRVPGVGLTHIARELLAEEDEEKPEDPTSIGIGVYAVSGGENYIPAFRTEKNKKFAMHFGTYNGNDKEGVIGCQVLDAQTGDVLASTETDKGAFLQGYLDFYAEEGFDKSRALLFKVGRATDTPHVFEPTHSTLVAVNVAGDVDYGIASTANSYGDYEDSKPYVVLANPALYDKWLSKEGLFKTKHPPTFLVPRGDYKLKFEAYNIGNRSWDIQGGYAFTTYEEVEDLELLYSYTLGYNSFHHWIEHADVELSVPREHKLPVLLGFGHLEGWWLWSEFKPDTALLVYSHRYPDFGDLIQQHLIECPVGLTESDLNTIGDRINDNYYWKGIAARTFALRAWPYEEPGTWIIEEKKTLAGYASSPFAHWAALVILAICASTAAITVTLAWLGKEAVHIWGRTVEAELCPYKCPWCGRCFTDYGEYCRHMDICPEKPSDPEDAAPPNSGKDPETECYKCPICGEPYCTTWAAYWGHMKANHPDALPDEQKAKLEVTTKRWGLPTYLPVTIELQQYEGVPFLGEWKDIKGYPKEVDKNPSEHGEGFVAGRNHRIRATRGKRIITEFCSDWEEIGTPSEFEDKKITLDMRTRFKF